jgi:hypothetical protein
LLCLCRCVLSWVLSVHVRVCVCVCVCRKRVPSAPPRSAHDVIFWSRRRVDHPPMSCVERDTKKRDMEHIAALMFMLPCSCGYQQCAVRSDLESRLQLHEMISHKVSFNFQCGLASGAVYAVVVSREASTTFALYVATSVAACQMFIRVNDRTICDSPLAVWKLIVSPISLAVRRLCLWDYLASTRVNVGQCTVKRV